MESLSVLLVGCGNIAGGFDTHRATAAPPVTHAGAYAAHGGYRLAACIEQDRDTRLAFMRSWRIPLGFAGFDELASMTSTSTSTSTSASIHTSTSTSTPAFDVVSICSPTISHFNDALRALKLQPRILFCEKPICSTVEQAEELVQRCRAANVHLAVNHNRRWDSSVIGLKSELASGQWGKVRSATGYYNKGILNNGSHMLDLMRDLLGPLELLHAGTPVYDYTDDDPSIPATLVSRAGVPVSLSCGHAADYSLFELQLVTERGTIRMESGGLTWHHRIAGPSLQFKGYQTLLPSVTVEGHYLQTMTAAVGNIYGVLTGELHLASTGETALQTHRLCYAIRQTATHGARLPI